MLYCYTNLKKGEDNDVMHIEDNDVMHIKFSSMTRASVIVWYGLL